MPTPSSPLPPLFQTEAILKLLSGATFLLLPTTILKNLTTAPYPAPSVALVRIFGSQTLAFSIPLFLAAREGAEARRLVYWTLLAREGFLGAALVGQLVGSYGGEGEGGREGEERDRLLEEGSLGGRDGEEDRRVGVGRLRCGVWGWMVVEVVPFVLGRGWVLGWKGDWF
ncbi:hypothetical protein P280DRAFT_504901 [Massarina eburnea CBS 473.64]|uniref:Uncharacterized protein n=1 Tax=Massarina eburnea CBS 473.64 TaxID=1395130 RepID=A0A6A6S8V8_9PLEO|nr:hypothetical protein P280DRAFT_504901 [Massarina eburnea CBS 473.64]